MDLRHGLLMSQKVKVKHLLIVWLVKQISLSRFCVAIGGSYFTQWLYRDCNSIGYLRTLHHFLFLDNIEQIQEKLKISVEYF